MTDFVVREIYPLISDRIAAAQPDAAVDCIALALWRLIASDRILLLRTRNWVALVAHENVGFQTSFRG